MDLDVIKVAVQILIPFVILFLGTIIAVFRYFLKRFTDDIKREFVRLETKIEENDKKVSEVERAFMAFQAQLPKEYVMRADYIRVTAIYEKKIDRLAELIGALDGTLQGQKAELKLLLVKIGDIDAKPKK